ncbi:MAG: aminomethyl-transferring glycine dehydrogenase subunit GcvPB [Spirochaetia bacterium]|nr:aminomethyl-transferring glycine dehydrogenase subunit GcvPB [Spirochaetia bacterium]
MDKKLQITRSVQVFEEPLLFERSRPGRVGVSLPSDDSNLPLEIDSSLLRDPADLPLPEVSEPEVVRHFTRLSTWNYGIDLNLYPLGSCTMKYNPRINEEIAADSAYANLHPSLPAEFAQHGIRITYELQEILKTVTDMKGITLQPAAGAHGELTGLFLVRAYLEDRKETHKTVVLVPDSAHGTNPATCTLAGFSVRELKSTEEGLLDVEALKAALTPDVAALMITNPNTLGIFETNIAVIADLLHKNGSLLYMDGANYNAIVGKVSLGKMGVDISHLNLHKTFSTPHGGGGPGAAAVVVSERVVDFLPGPIAEKKKDGTYGWTTASKSIGRVKAGPGHFGMIIRALTYILSYGNQLHRVAEQAVLNANIIRRALEEFFQPASPLDTMHEAVFSDAKQRKTGLETIHLAKTLIDYGYHPPTIYFPLSVKGAIMIEPTETESPETIAHFCEVMKDLAGRMAAQDESMKLSPQKSYVRKIDEVEAARKPVLNYFTKKT